MNTLKYVLKRLIYIVFVFFIISIIMFSIYKLVPGDPAAMMIDSKLQNNDPDRYQELYQRAQQRLGLDKPVILQYFYWMGNMLTGNFGYSATYQRNVIDIIKAPMLNTVMLNVTALILAFAITIPLGIITAVKRGSITDSVIQIGTVVGVSTPSFIFALIFIVIFGVNLQWFPISGVNSPGLSGNGLTMFFDKLYHMVLPLMVMTVASLAGITRYVRGAMIEALSQDFIRTARAKGLRERVVIYSHAFRNALIPVVTIMTSWFIGIFGGSVIVESIFAWNGIGNLLYQALRQHDFAVVLTMNMFYTVLTLAGNLRMDLSYLIVDPRVKLS